MKNDLTTLENGTGSVALENGALENLALPSVATKTDAQILSALHWRYAVRAFDPARKIADSTWRALEEALRLAPSSFGLQPWKFVVVTDPQVKAQLVKYSYGQQQITDCSHLLVIATKLNYTPEDTARFMERNAQVRGVDVNSLDGFASAINSAVESRTEEETAQWLRRQGYIALGVFLSAAAMLRVDACPMEGFSSADYDRVLGLEGSGYTAAVIAPAGYRNESDKYGDLPKVRFAHEDVFLHV